MKKILLWAALMAVTIALPLAAQMKPGAIIMTVNDQPIYSWEVGILIPQVQQELAGQVGAADVAKMLLTMSVPYCVSTYSSVGAILQSVEKRVE